MIRFKKASFTFISVCSRLRYLLVKKKEPMTKKASTPPPTNWKPATYTMKYKYSKEEEESQALNGSEITGRHCFTNLS